MMDRNMNQPISKDCVEAAYCFFHQKWQVYAYSDNAQQKDDIEYAIASYVSGMNQTLYSKLAQGKADFLCDHVTFHKDMQAAITLLEQWL